MGGLPLDFINQRGSASRFHQPMEVRLQISSTKRGSTSRFHQPNRDSINQKGGPPLGTISMDLVVLEINQVIQQPVKHTKTHVDQLRLLSGRFLNNLQGIWAFQYLVTILPDTQRQVEQRTVLATHRIYIWTESFQLTYVVVHQGGQGCDSPQ